jgi:thiol-disulfide isomerase/thioredoxin
MIEPPNPHGQAPSDETPDELLPSSGTPEPGSRERSRRVWTYVALGFVLIWVCGLIFFVPHVPRASLENSAMSEPADFNWSAHDLDGQPVPFARFRGKPVFLNFWATNCPPCVGELPTIAKLAANPRLQGKDIQFVCMSVDASADTVRRFLKGKDWSMTFLRTDRVPQVFQTEGIPSTFLIDPAGRIASFELGPADWSAPQVVAFLEKLARSPAKTP